MADVERLDALPSGPALVVRDDVFVTQHALRAFLALAGGQPAQMGVAESLFLKDSLPLQEGLATRGDAAAVFGIARVSGPLEDLESLPVVTVDLAVEEKTVDGIPTVFTGGEEVRVPWTSRPVMHLSHWVHLVRANQYALMATVAGFRERPRWRNWISIAGLLLRAFPPTEARVGRALVQKGRGCKIHPTAVVEASRLGDRVQVGPHAIVRACVLDDDVVIQPHGHCEMSALGRGAVLGKQTWINFVVGYPGAVMTAHAQMSVFGAESFVATYSPLQDLAFEGEVKVEKQGQVVTCGSRFMGVCIGHRARIGGGVFVAHGRAVPNDAVIVKNPSDVVRRIEMGEGFLTVHEGTAKPIDRVPGLGAPKER